MRTGKGHRTNPYLEREKPTLEASADLERYYRDAVTILRWSNDILFTLVALKMRITTVRMSEDSLQSVASVVKSMVHEATRLNELMIRPSTSTRRSASFMENTSRSTRSTGKGLSGKKRGRTRKSSKR